jgi:hypothetical protein
VSGDYRVVHGKIEAPIPLMLRGVGKEDTSIRTAIELVGSGDREVGVASAPKT